MTGGLNPLGAGSSPAGPTNLRTREIAGRSCFPARVVSRDVIREKGEGQLRVSM
jgi:hypothetical protein